MKTFRVCVLVCVFASIRAKEEHKAAVEHKDEHKVEAFSKSKITPDVVHVAPSKVLKIEYKNAKKEVALGNELAPKDVKEQPTVSYSGEPNAFYTLVMSDPDAPSRQKHTMKEWNHWLVGNIPGSDLAKGQVLSEYIGAGPPKDTGLHRYVFLLYKQPGKLNFTEEHKTKTNGNRGKFSTEDFAKKYGLGNPVAGNYFQAKFDDSVPALHKSLH